MRKSTRNAATRKCLTIRCRLSAMFMFCSTAWAPRTSQLMPDQHSRSQMTVLISEASSHTSTRNCLLVSSPAKCSRQQSANTTSQVYKLCQPKQAIACSQCQKPTCDLYRQAIPFGCGIHLRARTSRSWPHFATTQIKTKAPTAL